MKSSENLNELFKAMAEFRAKVKQPAKNAQNPFFKSSYVQLEGVQNAIDEAIKGTGLSYVQLTHNTENGVEGWHLTRQRKTLKVTVRR